MRESRLCMYTSHRTKHQHETCLKLELGEGCCSAAVPVGCSHMALLLMSSKQFLHSLEAHNLPGTNCHSPKEKAMKKAEGRCHKGFCGILPALSLWPCFFRYSTEYKPTLHRGGGGGGVEQDTWRRVLPLGGVTSYSRSSGCTRFPIRTPGTKLPEFLSSVFTNPKP